MKKIITISIILTIGFKSSAQSDFDQLTSKIELIATVKKDVILLRWAPNKPVIWDLANQYGYTLEKFVISRDSVLLDIPEKISLTDSTMMPLPLDQWPKNQNDKYEAITAQAIYGEQFALSRDQTDMVSSIINKVKEQESRFSFALYAADQSFEVAKLSGLAFKDHEVQENEKYLYRIYANIPPEIQQVDTGIVFVGLENQIDLKPIENIIIKYENNAVDLRWPTLYYDDSYTGYFIERSLDGISFQSISEQPLINLSKSINQNPYHFYYQDKIESFKPDKLYYRVWGVTAFGEKGPVSEILTVNVNAKISISPYVESAEVTKSESVKLVWSFKQDSLIDGFKVMKAPKLDGKYQIIADSIPSEKKEFIDLHPSYSNYYKIVAFKSGAFVSSMAKFVALPDDTPPSVPASIIGKMDSSGIVKLSWDHTVDNDIDGYRLYRSNYPDEEFSQITSSVIKKNFFEDSIKINTLNENIYYKIMSIDQRGNHSELSKSICIKKPDIIPPVAPAFYRITNNVNSIILHWHPSVSIDVHKTYLMRRVKSASKWDTLKVYSASDSASLYEDKIVEEGINYEYVLIAQDDSGLIAKSKPVEGGITITNRTPIANLTAKVFRTKGQIELSWLSENSEIDLFQIYKEEDNQGLRLVESVSGSNQVYKDVRLSINSIYKYRILAIYHDGSQSKFSEELVIKY